jgi:hypothetical protein
MITWVHNLCSASSTQKGKPRCKVKATRPRKVFWTDSLGMDKKVNVSCAEQPFNGANIIFKKYYSTDISHQAVK